MNKRHRRVTAACIMALSLVGAGCDSSDTADGAVEVTVVGHDSFAISEEVIEKFEEESGIRVVMSTSGDAGTVLSEAILTKDKPTNDILFGVDNTLLTKATSAGIFAPYKSSRLEQVPDEYELDGSGQLTPIDHGDVCVDYDKKYFTDRNLAVPASLDDLRKPEYKDLLVVEDPTVSSPGLAFLLATVAQFRDQPGGWQQYWRDLGENGVEVAGSWDDAWNASFSAGPGAGSRPLVVSYASSPPSDIDISNLENATTNVGVIESTCFRQVEFAGILKGTKREAEAQKVIDFLLSTSVQNEVPDQMYVYPVATDAVLPEVFSRFAAPIADPIELPADQIGANRDAWVEEWIELSI